MRVFVGCCGFPIGRRKYYSLFPAVELQETFYNMPDPERMRKLRAEAPENFRFAMKAWQALTHPPNMRTWRRSKVKIPKELWGKYGYLRPTTENFSAWEAVREAAKALGAEVVVLQLPPSFGYTDENLRNLSDFLTAIEPAEFKVGIELRGEWRKHGDALAEILGEHKNVIHVVDPFRWRPVKPSPTYYFRLHGIGGKEVNYGYKYTDKDLRALRDIVESVGSAEQVFVMFNNKYMRDDALRFKEILESAV
ncbi:MAG: DUF72 domain-containing protein [Desulfurococcales archaeon]|nr:DUF72 domain-containing protein [Desulfurococcales archaeon]